MRSESELAMDCEKMDKTTVRVPRRSLNEIDEMVDAGRFPSQSDAIRVAIHRLVEGHSAE